MGHTIKENAPQKFEELRQLIRREFYTAVSWENAVEMRRKQYADALGREISREYAEEEVVCNSLGRLLGNERVMEKLAGEHRNLFAKIWRAVKAFFEKLFGGMTKDYSAKTPEQVLVENGTRKAQRKLEDAFVRALRASSEASGAIAELTVTDEAKTADTAEKSTVTSTKEENVNVSGEEKSSLSDKYTFDALTNKGDLLIIDLPYVSEDESIKYRSDTITFGKEMRNLASSFNNSKNTATSTYLFCPDLNHDVLITRQSFKHGAERIDNAYIAICKSARNILENSIVVNEIVERANTSGGYVLLGIAQNDENYVIVRSVINKKTWKLDEYEELSAIRKKSIKKEDVGFKPPHYIHKNGYETSSAISIADFLENVKNIPLVNEVFSMDVAGKLGVTRSKGTLSGSLRYSLPDTVEKKVLEKYGRTFSWNTTGYILKNGTKLDLSGKSVGAPGGYRALDHRDIFDIYEVDSYTEAMIEFMIRGNIRVAPESPGINLIVEPTEAQYEQITSLVERLGWKEKEFHVDFDNENGSTIGSLDYDGNISARKVIADIKYFFKEGKLPYQSNLSQFRYSLSDTEQREELASAFYGLAQTQEEREIVLEYKREIESTGKRIARRAELIRRLEELEGKRGFGGERSSLRAAIKELTEKIEGSDTKLFELEAAQPFRDVMQKYRKSVPGAAKNDTGILTMSRGQYNAAVARIKNEKVYSRKDAAKIADLVNITQRMQASSSLSENTLHNNCIIIFAVYSEISLQITSDGKTVFFVQRYSA